jgi:hypothetical protein
VLNNKDAIFYTGKLVLLNIKKSIFEHDLYTVIHSKLIHDIEKNSVLKECLQYMHVPAIYAYYLQITDKKMKTSTN